MTGDLYINGYDAYTSWGINMEDTALSALMTPPPNKPFVQSKSRLKHGKTVVMTNAKVDERTVTLPFHLLARNKSDFYAKYSLFCQELEKGELKIRTRYQPTVVYKMVYESCTQFSQFMEGMAKFSLKLTEPNPKDRCI